MKQNSLQLPQTSVVVVVVVFSYDMDECIFFYFSLLGLDFCLA